MRYRNSEADVKSARESLESKEFELRLKSKREEAEIRQYMLLLR